MLWGKMNYLEAHKQKAYISNQLIFYLNITGVNVAHWKGKKEKYENLIWNNKHINIKKTNSASKAITQHFILSVKNIN